MKALKSLLFVFAIAASIFTNANAQSTMTSNPEGTATLILPAVQTVTESPRGTASAETIEVKLRSLREGMNTVGKNPETGSMLMAFVEKGEIRGFRIVKASGIGVNLGIVYAPGTSAGPQPPEFGCPDGFVGELVCYTHPVYEVTVCWMRCTPTSITIGLNPGW